MLEKLQYFLSFEDLMLKKCPATCQWYDQAA